MPLKSVIKRRQFLKGSAGLLTASLFSPVSIAKQPVSKDHRRLVLKNLHTGERCDTTFWEEGKYVYSGLSQLNKLMRDHRQNEVSEIDPGVFDQMALLQQKLGAKGEIQIISGYRSSKTNELLRSHSNGVARKSYHMVGRAVDLSIPGADLSVTRQAALSLKAGGVGYYPSSGFIHLDTGPVRQWS